MPCAYHTQITYRSSTRLFENHDIIPPMTRAVRRDILFPFIIFLSCLALYGFKLGAFGFLDPDEPFYALTAREMLARHEWLTPFLFGKPQFEKPALFYWVVGFFFKLFGTTETAARLGPLVAGTGTVVVTYFWGRVLFKRSEIAFLSAVILATTAEFIVLSRIVLTDMFLCFFVTLALFLFSLGEHRPKHRAMAWHLMFAAGSLGFLTKGLLGFVLPFSTIALYLFISEPALLGRIPWFSGTALFMALALPWYGFMTYRYGAGFLEHFFIHENVRRFFVAEHQSFDRVYFYPLGMLLCFFPWSAFLPASFCSSFRQAKYGQRSQGFLLVGFAGMFLFFMLAKSKLLSYIFPLFPLAALIVGDWTYRLLRMTAARTKMNPCFVFLSLVFFVIAPVAMVAGVAFQNFSGQLHASWTAIFAAVAIFIPLGFCSFFCLLRRKYRRAFFCIAAASVCLTVVAFGWLLPSAEGEFSSKQQAAAYLKLNGSNSRGFLLAGKLTVRGVCYYTGNDHIGVLADDPRGLFYTKHPVPILSTREDLLNIQPSDFPVYCFLRPKEFDFLKTLVDERFHVDVIESNAERILARMDRVA